MKKRLLSFLLSGTMLFGASGELLPIAAAVNTDVPQMESAAESAAQETPSASSISVHPSELWLNVQEQKQLTASVLPDTAEDPVLWSSDHPDICSVDAAGMVTAQANGTATLTAQAGTVSATCTVHVGLAAPVLAAITVNSDQHAALSWSAVPNCDGYRVYRRPSASDSWQSMETLTDTQWTDTTMTAASGYQYAVRAYKLRDSQTDDEATMWSEYSSETVPVVETPPTADAGLTKPAAPTLVSAEAVSYGRNRITWNPVSGADGYRVYRKAGSNWHIVCIIKNPSASSCIDRMVSPDHTYTYTVRAFCRGGGKILLSDYDTTGVSVTSATIPAPKLGTVTCTGYDRLKITWTPSTRAEGYTIYRRTSAAEKWVYLDTVDGEDAASYTDTTVTCGTTYFYTVRAYYTANGSTAYSSYNDAGISGRAVLDIPALKGASSASATSVQVKWTPVDGATGYRIYRKTSSSDAWTYLTYVENQSRASYTDTGLKQGQRYYYTVSAYRRLSSSSFFYGSYNETGVSAVPSAPAYSNIYATYSTSYSASNANRTTNLNIACKTITGTVVKPGETFSFNNKLGKRTSDKGYKPATIFTGGSGTAQELGGGICQVASTMFNTALLANVTIKERYPHSQKVSYVPLGRDAGIYYGSKDFRFTNNTKYNIKIKSWISGGTLTVQFLTTEQVKPPTVKLTVAYSGGTYTLKRSVNGTVNYTTTSRYG